VKNYQTYPEWRDSRKIFKETKFVTRGDFIYGCIKDYVIEYLNSENFHIEHYSKFWSILEEMIGKQMSLNQEIFTTTIIELIWRVSYFHYQVGSVLPFLYDASYIRWAPNEKPTKAGLWTLVAGFATCARQYQLINFTNPKVPIWKDLQQKLIPGWIPDIWNYDRIYGVPDWIWELEVSVAR